MPHSVIFIPSSPNLVFSDMAAGQDSDFYNFILINRFQSSGDDKGRYSTRLPRIIWKREPVSSHKHIVEFVRDIVLESAQSCITCEAIHKGDGPHEGRRWGKGCCHNSSKQNHLTLQFSASPRSPTKEWIQGHPGAHWQVHLWSLVRRRHRHCENTIADLPSFPSSMSSSSLLLHPLVEWKFHAPVSTRSKESQEPRGRSCQNTWDCELRPTSVPWDSSL